MKKIPNLGLVLLLFLCFSCQEDEAPKSNTKEVSKVEVNPKTLSLFEKETKEITVQVLPDNAEDKSISWSSSDAKIASVSEAGLITAIKEGSVFIIAKATNNIADTCRLTVNKVIEHDVNTFYYGEKDKDYSIGDIPKLESSSIKSIEATVSVDVEATFAIDKVLLNNNEITNPGLSIDSKGIVSASKKLNVGEYIININAAITNGEKKFTLKNTIGVKVTADLFADWESVYFPAQPGQDIKDFDWEYAKLKTQSNAPLNLKDENIYIGLLTFATSETPSSEILIENTDHKYFDVHPAKDGVGAYVQLKPEINNLAWIDNKSKFYYLYIKAGVSEVGDDNNIATRQTFAMIMLRTPILKHFSYNTTKNTYEIFSTNGTNKTFNQVIINADYTEHAKIQFSIQEVKINNVANTDDYFILDKNGNITVDTEKEVPDGTYTIKVLAEDKGKSPTGEEYTATCDITVYNKDISLSNLEYTTIKENVSSDYKDTILKSSFTSALADGYIFKISDDKFKTDNLGNISISDSSIETGVYNFTISIVDTRNNSQEMIIQEIKDLSITIN